MKKISFKFEEQTGEDTWVLCKANDTMTINTDLTSPKDLLPLAQDQIDEVWNSRLRSHENPRRITEIVKVEDYVAPEKRTGMTLTITRTILRNGKEMIFKHLWLKW